jgi:transcription elongation factor GreA
MSSESLLEAATSYVASLDGKARVVAQAEVNRFVRWYGANRPAADLRGHDVSVYGEELGPATDDAKRRAEQVRNFLSFLKKKGITSSSLAPHLRLRKSTKSVKAGSNQERKAIELTADGHQALQQELESLKEQRPHVREEIRTAMLDKDFRENAPLDAAKDKQAHLESRIREIEETLKHAEIVEKRKEDAGSQVHIGCTVGVTNLGSGVELRYTIVGSNEGNAAAGRISNASPIGNALIGGSVGDEVVISVPAGTLRLRIESIEG